MKRYALPDGSRRHKKLADKIINAMQASLVPVALPRRSKSN